ncbi:structure-specific endonuclease subunit SLX4 [Calliphora vicina]|uniref:structure-specific endonuclease subunit SLX4 n=1 Tax=Calliphora vicina TaxID=7373 RepID=UPI00325A4DE5
MDRQTRKANLKKLQLPSTSGNKQQRKTRQTAKSIPATANTAITNYFLTPEKSNKDPVEETKDRLGISPIALAPNIPKEDVPASSDIPVKPATRTRTKRTKLDDFIFKDPNEIPDSIKNAKNALHDDNFIVPEKKAKRAPKLTLSGSQAKTSKSSRSKKQTTIKSAFLRNEQLFAEIAAQHCAADQFDGDDVQLALAISRSEAESKGLEVMNDHEIEDEVNLVDGNKDAESIREKLKKYGFRTADKTDYNTFAAAFLPKTNGRRGKSKWANKFTALTLRSPENQLKKLQDNIEKLLNSQFHTKRLSEQESLLSQYKPQSSLLKKANVHANKIILENVENINQPNDWYFVSELFDVNQLPAGHLLKDWTAIQGRDLTPTTKTKEITDKLQKLQNIYRDLEEYFSSRKRLDWTIDNENKEEQEVLEIKDNDDNKKEESPKQTEDNINTAANTKVVENQELAEMVDLIEDMQRNETEIAEFICDKKILKLLTCTKYLDTMQVSSCSINTQDTINTTQKEESNNSLAEISDDAKNMELDEMVDLTEDVQGNKREIENTGTQLTNIICDNNVLKHLQTSKLLDIKQVSSFNRNTQATINTTQKKESLEQTKSNTSLAEISDNSQTNELDEMIDLIEDMQRNEAEIENTVVKQPTNTICDNNNPTLLDIKQVSSCTINATQKPRSNSPDLFADSDVEMEECDKEVDNKTEVKTVISDAKDKSRNSSIDDMEVGVNTYEIFSSDEVKNTSSSEQNDSTLKEPSSTNLSIPDDNIIDLTQDDLQISTHNKSHNFNQSKPIEEIDLFAESPSQEEYQDLADINSNRQKSKDVQENHEETFKFSLTMETNEKEETQEQLKEFSTNKELEDIDVVCIDDIVLHEIAMDQTNTSFLNFQGSKQLETCFHKETATKEKEIIRDSLSANDTVFRELCNRYVNEDNNISTSKDKQNTDFVEILPIIKTPKKLTLETQEQLKEFSTNKVLEDDDIVLSEIAMDQTNTSFLNFQGSKQLETCFHKETATKENETIVGSLSANDTVFRELCKKYINEANNTSTSKDKQNTDSNILPTIKPPEKCEQFTNFTMDFDMTVDTNLTLKRKSMSFTAKTPLKMHKMSSNTVLTKSQSFNKSNMENVSIDLTQNEDDDDDIEQAEDDDDECLVLSDDEINYSIWQANKTANFQTSEQSQHEDDVISISDKQAASDEEQQDSDKEKIIEFPTKDKSVKEFSHLDLKDKDTSLIKVELLPEQSYSEIEVLTSKYSAAKTSHPDDLKVDRSKFGILEEYYEPMDFTPNLCTPRKVLNEASFLRSPSETTAPMKRYSNCHRSSQKFQDLINNIGAKSPTSNFNDFDEFDLMVYKSPPKTVISGKKPQGIEQLLTAEISFKERQNYPQLQKSPTSIIPLKTTQEVTYNNKTYTIRYTSSPKPDFMKYSEAELLKQLYNFGIKPLKRKQAVKMLEYIYNQTHPIVMEDDKVETPKQDIIDMEEFDLPCTSKAALRANSMLTKPSEILVSNPIISERESAEILLDVDNKKLNLQDSCGLEMLRYCIDLKAELLNEEYILQTNVTKKTPQPLLPFHIAWYNLVCSNPKLHENILMYEPIDLQEIYLFLKGLGYRYDPKDLKIFFDRRCIIFRYDLTSADVSKGKTNDTNRHVRKSKKTKVTKK